MYQITCTIIESGKVVVTPFSTAESMQEYMIAVVWPNVFAGIITHDSTVRI